jgi:lysine/ornithine N-monooxygenase
MKYSIFIKFHETFSLSKLTHTIFSPVYIRSSARLVNAARLTGIVLQRMRSHYYGFDFDTIAKAPAQ